MLIHSLHLLATSIVTGHGVRLPEDQWVASVRFLVVVLSRGLLSDMKLHQNLDRRRIYDNVTCCFWGGLVTKYIQWVLTRRLHHFFCVTACLQCVSLPIPCFINIPNTLKWTFTMFMIVLLCKNWSLNKFLHFCNLIFLLNCFFKSLSLDSGPV